MNCKPQGLVISKAMVGFLQYKGAEGLAPVTVAGYERDLELWIENMGDIDVLKITPQHVLSFMNFVRMDYKPRRIAGDNSKRLARVMYSPRVIAFEKRNPLPARKALPQSKESPCGAQFG
jgi:hypothetical protein